MNNTAAVYHSLAVPVAASACSPVNYAKEETLPTEASTNWRWNCYRKYKHSASLSLGGQCMICFTNCTNLYAYWNRKHGEVTKGVRSLAYTTYDDGTERVFSKMLHIKFRTGGIIQNKEYNKTQYVTVLHTAVNNGLLKDLIHPTTKTSTKHNQK